MRVRASIAVLAGLLALIDAAGAGAATDGPTGSTLLDGGWLLRLDPSGIGLRHHWMRSRAVAVSPRASSAEMPTNTKTAKPMARMRGPRDRPLF